MGGKACGSSKLQMSWLRKPCVTTSCPSCPAVKLADASVRPSNVWTCWLSPTPVLRTPLLDSYINSSDERTCRHLRGTVPYGTAMQLKPGLAMRRACVRIGGNRASWHPGQGSGALPWGWLPKRISYISLSSNWTSWTVGASTITSSNGQQVAVLREGPV